MPTVGPTDRPEVFEWWEATRNQNANRLLIPERLRITQVGAWIRGINGFDVPSYRLCIWDSSGNLEWQGPLETISRANVGVSNLSRVEVLLDEPYEAAEGALVYVGVSWSPNGAMQLGFHDHGTADTPDEEHVDDSSGSIAQNLTGFITHGVGAAGFYIAAYEPIAGAWVRRSGSWVRADSVHVRRSGAWVEVDSISVRRGSSWVEAD